MTEAKTQGAAAPQKALSIYEAITAITGEVAPIAKNRKNPQQGYSFRGIDDVYAALNLLLAKHGVSILPTILTSEHDEFPTKSGGKMFRHRLRIRYKLIANDGSHDFAETEGEGMDTGDKATPKAFSTAFKTMAFQVFCIPTGEKVDSEEDSPEVATEPAKTNGNHRGPPMPSGEPRAAPNEPEHLFEGFKKRLLEAKDIPTIGKVAEDIKLAVDKSLISDGQKKLLLGLYTQRVNEIGGRAVA